MNLNNLLLLVRSGRVFIFNAFHKTNFITHRIGRNGYDSYLHVSGSVRVCDGQNRERGFAQPLAEGFHYCKAALPLTFRGFAFVLHFEAERITLKTNFYMETKLDNKTEPQHDAKLLLAADLIKWLETERTILFNHAAYMLDPVEYRKTMDVINSINMTLEYVKLSKICG